MTLGRDALVEARQGAGALLAKMFSDTTPQDLVDALAGRRAGEFTEWLARWLYGVGYWRGNIRRREVLPEDSSAPVKYWHQDESTAEERSDRLSLPFLELGTARIRGFAERMDLERSWRTQAADSELEVKDTTSFRCIHWLQQRVFMKESPAERPICVVHAGEIALSLILTDPGLLIPNPDNVDSSASVDLVPITVERVRGWIDAWLPDPENRQTPAHWHPDGFRDAFLASIAPAKKLRAWLEEAFEGRTDVVRAAESFRALATAFDPDIPSRAGTLQRVWPKEWQLVGTRSVMLWPILRIAGAGFPEEREVYALVVPQPNIVVDRDRAIAVRETLDLLFQQTIASELLMLHRERTLVHQARALHAGILHELQGLANLILTTFGESEQVDLVEPDVRCATRAADAYWRAIDQGAKPCLIGSVADSVLDIATWPDIQLDFPEGEEWRSLTVDHSLEFVLLELCRNAYTHTEAGPVQIQIEVEGDGTAVSRLILSHRGTLHESKVVDTRAGKYPVEEEFKGRHLVTNLVTGHRHLNGHWTLHPIGENVVAVIEVGEAGHA